MRSDLFKSDGFSMDKIRLVTLDMVGTIIKFSHPPVSQYQRVAARYLVCITGLSQLPDSDACEATLINYLTYLFLVMDMKLSSILWLRVSCISGRL